MSNADNCPLPWTGNFSAQGKQCWHNICIKNFLNLRRKKEEGMKKTLALSVTVTLILLLSSNFALSSPHKNSTPTSFLTLSFSFKPISIGYKHQLFDHVYAAGNFEYRRSETDLEFRAGAEYLIPRKILFFRLYGGGGIQFSRNEGYQYPYLVLGTTFFGLFFYEFIHPLESMMEARSRFGLRLKF